jgi:acetyl-CoA C-acetyltransferase
MTKDLEALFVGNMLTGILGSQEHVGALFAEELGISGGAIRVEGACASGGLAIHTAVHAIQSGMYETVAVLGIEKMTDHRPEDVASALMAAGSSEERSTGVTFPGLYAMLARAYMEKYGATEEDLASVAVKNHFHASLNPLAQYPFPISIESVMRSPAIAEPLKLFDCSPISDGAACVILSSRPSEVRVEASVIASDTLGIANRKTLTGLDAAVRAGKKAYEQAGVGPKDIDVAEVHDCFTIAELFALEDLGFYPLGTAGIHVRAGEVTLGKSKKLVVNSSGGLKACGHPVGATGVKQIIELTNQLRGKAGKRQVPDANIGLSHNIGGSGATAVVHILKREV